jgi:hypothetical protein
MGIPKYSRAPPDATVVEDRKYCTVYKAPDDQTYIFWKGTTPPSFGSIDEWWEDAEAAVGHERVFSWDKEIEYIMYVYGMESDTVHHDGYSRGGAFAQHFGGIGYGSAEFSKYPPAPGSQSRGADDWFHKYTVPMINQFDKMIPDTSGDHPHTMDTDDGAFDSPRGPVVDPKAPKQSRPAKDYSGFAAAFVGFPAKIKYDRKRNIAHHVYGTKHVHPKRHKSRKRLFFQINDSAMRAPVNDTPMEV